MVDNMLFIAYLLEGLGALFLAKNFISIKIDDMISESSSGWFASENVDYIKRYILLKEETKLGICFILLGIFIKIIYYFSKISLCYSTILIMILIVFYKGGKIYIDISKEKENIIATKKNS